VDHAAGPDLNLLAIEDHLALATQDVVELGADFVVVGFRAVDIDRMGPGRNILVALAEETVTIPAGAGLGRGFILVTDDEIGWFRLHEMILSWGPLVIS
jgi:hypothetical protein